MTGLIALVLICVSGLHAFVGQWEHSGVIALWAIFFLLLQHMVDAS
jgi:hypothetical protein